MEKQAMMLPANKMIPLQLMIVNPSPTSWIFDETANQKMYFDFIDRPLINVALLNYVISFIHRLCFGIGAYALKIYLLYVSI